MAAVLARTVGGGGANSLAAPAAVACDSLDDMLFRATVLVLALGLFFSCGPETPPAPPLIGTWQRTSGTLLQAQGLEGLGWLELKEDGSGTLFAKSGAGVVGCAPVVQAQLSEEVLFLDVPALAHNRAYRWAVEGEVLTVTDERDARTTFTRKEAVPAADRCVTAAPLRTHSLTERPAGNGGLGDDGMNLWFTRDSDSVLRAVVPETGALGTTVTLLSSYDKVVAMQGADFWAHCGCGGSDEIQRRTVADGLVDSINTELDLGNQLSIRGGAWDGTHLWLSGLNRDTDQSQLLKVQSGDEPDTLVATITLASGLALRGLAATPTHLWGITHFLGDVLVRLDPVTGAVDRTLSLPVGPSWSGVAIRGDRAWLVGTQQDYSGGVLIEVPL